VTPDPQTAGENLPAKANIAGFVPASKISSGPAKGVGRRAVLAQFHPKMLKLKEQSRWTAMFGRTSHDKNSIFALLCTFFAHEISQMIRNQERSRRSK
jgi:hypothetical protein